MRLPCAEEAIVTRKKIEHYLLCFDHPTGRFKAEFFSGYGFSVDSWNVLADALTRHATAHDVAELVDSAFGTKYIIEGSLDAPDGRRPFVRVVWFVERGETAPRLVTAYPC